MIDAAPPGLRVLFYHRVNPYPFASLGPVSREITVTPEVFSRQLAYLKAQGYRTPEPSELVSMLQGTHHMDGKYLLITFDDGYEDNYLWAEPLLRRYGLRAIFFITAGLVGRESGEAWGNEGDPPGYGRFLTWEQIREMRDRGAYFGSHTCNHRLLTTLAEPNLRHELVQPRQTLAEQLGNDVWMLAYPGGDFDNRVREAAADAGYRLAFTTAPGTNPAGTPLDLLHRTELSASDTFFLFKMKVAGALDWLRFKESPALRTFIGWCNRRLIGMLAIWDRPSASGRSGMQPAEKPPQPIRLLQIVSRMGIGGVPEHLSTLIRGLAGNGYEITLMCREISREREELLSTLGVRVIRVDLERLPNPVADLRALVRLYRMIRDGGYDIVHTHTSKAALLGGIAGRMVGTPVVVNTAHNLGFLALSNPLLRMMFWLYDKTLFTLTTDAVITVSERVRQAVVRNRIVGPSAVVAIPNGIDPAPFDSRLKDPDEIRRGLGLNPGHIVIGTVARLVWFKGLDTLIAAAADVVKVFSEVRFVIVGDGPLREKLEEQAKGLGIGQCVIFLGERRDVTDLLPVLDLFVLPSVSEGMPITILEAMAASKAVVSTDTGGTSEIVQDGETGVLVPPRDSRRLGAAISGLLRNRALRARMGMKGRERLGQMFGAGRMVSATDSLYRRLLQQADCPRKDLGSA